MSITLTFAESYAYNTLLSGITVPIKLESGKEIAAFDAKLDTGSTHCIFQRKHGERLNLEIESGDYHEFSTATGKFAAFGHEVTISVLEIIVYSKVYFAADEYFSRNVLGRNGWLDRMEIGLIDNDGKLFLSSYGMENY